MNAFGITRESWLFHVCRDRILLAEKYERCRIALAPGPIRRLPPEIISEIFRYCLPLLCRPDPSDSPLLLCRVSSLWRDIAHATRDLWNHLDFTNQRKPDLERFIPSLPTPTHPTTPLHQWLSHTRTSQLDLSFQRSGTGVLPYLVSTVLLPNITDVFRLEIQVVLRTSRGPFQHFSVLPPHVMHNLKYLILTQGLGNAQVTVFQLSPYLTHLLLDVLDFAVDPYDAGDIPLLHPVFPWGNLTHLTITRCIEPEIFISALSSCQSLEVALFSIDLRGNSGDDGHGSDSEDENGEHGCDGPQFPRLDQPNVLSCLRELDIIVGCGLSFPLEDFRFPALKALRFHRGHMPQIPLSQLRLTVGQQDHFYWKNSITFLSELRSLNILSLAGRIGSVEEIMTLLHHVPGVDFLDLNITVDHLALFHALTGGLQIHPTRIPLPHLNCLRLRLEPSDMPSFSEAALREMVLSRSQCTLRSSTSRLENLSITSSTFSQEHVQCIEKIGENASSYIKTTVGVERNADRIIPWRRHVGQSLWR